MKSHSFTPDTVPLRLSEKTAEFLKKASGHASTLIFSEEYQAALKLLFKANALLEYIVSYIRPYIELHCTILSTMAYAYKITGQYALALNCLNEIILLSQKHGVSTYFPITYINISGVLSLLLDYKQARANAVKAVEYYYKLYGEKERTKEGDALVGYAYYNVGIQDEQLGNYAKAMEFYEKASLLVLYNSEATEDLKEAVKAAVKRLQSKDLKVLTKITRKKATSKEHVYSSKTSQSKNSESDSNSSLYNSLLNWNKSSIAKHMEASTYMLNAWVRGPLQKVNSVKTLAAPSNSSIAELKDLGALEWSDSEDETTVIHLQKNKEIDKKYQKTTLNKLSARINEIAVEAQQGIKVPKPQPLFRKFLGKSKIHLAEAVQRSFMKKRNNVTSLSKTKTETNLLGNSKKIQGRRLINKYREKLHIRLVKNTEESSISISKKLDAQTLDKEVPNKVNSHAEQIPVNQAEAKGKSGNKAKAAVKIQAAYKKYAARQWYLLALKKTKRKKGKNLIWRGLCGKHSRCQAALYKTEQKELELIVTDLITKQVKRHKQHVLEKDFKEETSDIKDLWISLIAKQEDGIENKFESLVNELTNKNERENVQETIEEAEVILEEEPPKELIVNILPIISLNQKAVVLQRWYRAVRSRKLCTLMKKRPAATLYQTLLKLPIMCHKRKEIEGDMYINLRFSVTKELRQVVITVRNAITKQYFPAAFGIRTTEVPQIKSLCNYLFVKCLGINEYLLDIDPVPQITESLELKSTPSTPLSLTKRQLKPEELLPNTTPSSIKQSLNNPREEGAARVIQSFYKMHMARTIVNYMRQEAHLRSSHKFTVAITKAYIIQGRYTITKILCNEHYKQLKLKIYDCDEKTTQTFLVDNFCYDNLAPEDFLVEANKIVSQIEYNLKYKTYCFITGSEPELPVLSITNLDQKTPEPPREVLLRTNSIGENYAKQIIYDGTRKFADQHYFVQVFLAPTGELKVLAANEQNSENVLKLNITCNVGMYLGMIRTQNAETFLGKAVYNLLTLNKKYEKLEIDEDKLAGFLRKEAMATRESRLVKLQARFRGCLTKHWVSKVIENKNKALNLFTSFALKLGRQYHFIKLLKCKENSNCMFVKSNKAVNQVELLLDKLLPGVNMDNKWELIVAIQARLREILAFNPSKRCLVLYNRRKNKML